MRIEFIYYKILKLFVVCGCYILSTKALVSPELFKSPCSKTFQYQMNENGGLYGIIGIYSFNKNVVQLGLQLSVGNGVNKYNGHIELAHPKNQVIEDVLHQRPVKYKVFFPRWQHIPPRITKITVNGQVVCSGPPLPILMFQTVICQRKIMDLGNVLPENIKNATTQALNRLFQEKSKSRYEKMYQTFTNLQRVFTFIGFQFLVDGRIQVVTTINLQHTLTIKMALLQAYHLILSNSPRKTDNSFSLNFSPEKLNNPVIKGDGSANGNVFVLYEYMAICSDTFGPTNPFSDCDSLTATREKINSQTTSDFTFSKNPFLTRNETVSKVTFKNSQRKIKSVLSHSPAISSDICGKTVVPNPLIVNGNSVPRGAFPWLVAMFRVVSTGLEYKCSGSLISKKHVVTAAHCIEQGYRRISPDKLLFVLGKLNIQRWTLSKGETLIEAEDIKVHPEFEPGTSDADIAVAVLSQEVQFSIYIRPICLWSESDDLQSVIGKTGKVVGWGKDENGGIITAEPKQTIMPIVTQEQCLWSSEAFKYITSQRTFCAGDRNGNGPCNGDSGSGFIMMRHDRWVLRGIVSISTYDSNKQTCDLSNYVVFTDVSKFKLWLSSFI